jgi:quinol-cytochrome oxidoreductase complex cytochrome b subunit
MMSLVVVASVAHIIFFDAQIAPFYGYFYGLFAVGALLVYALGLINRSSLVGFAYLGYLGVKLLFFLLFFSDEMTSLETSNVAIRLSYLVSFFLPLILEVASLYLYLNQPSKAAKNQKNKSPLF